MKFKKLIATIISATIFTSLVVDLPANITKAAVDYTYLDSQAYSGSDLGATYSANSTTFKVWAPTASSVQVKRYKTGSDSESGAGVIATDTMTKGSNGVWSISISGDLKNQYYTYLVTVDGTTKETVDIYAKAAGVNGNRGMVADLASTNPSNWSSDQHIICKNTTDATVWEAHVKDFSSAANSGVSNANKGKYLAFTEKNTTLNNDGTNPTCLNYLKKLGVTHIQLLPIFDYASVDETNSASAFNWGYDPKNYNVPEGSYSSNPYDGNVRINELKQAVQSIHSEGIGIVMDVVFNHTYNDPTSGNDTWFTRTVPGYYYRYTSSGAYSNGSGCGNETRSESAMYRKYMIDSILYWYNEYHIDGFRFDLMGVHDVTTMNEIRAALNKINPNILVYGEPWSGGTTTSSATLATQSNMSQVDSYVGAFNDKIRDAIKGGTWGGANSGFVQGVTGLETAIKGGIQGNSTTMAGTNQWSKQPSQTVSYVSCHDNYTLYDHLCKTVKGGGYNNKYDDVVQMNKLAAGIYLTSQGMTFMQAGEEFARTKGGDDNSYKSSYLTNQLDWSRTTDYASLVSWYKGLIAIRQSYSPFRDPTNTSNGTIYFSWGSACPSNVVAYTMYNKLNPSTEWNYVGVIHNANNNSATVTLQGYNTLPTQWVVIADGTKAGVDQLSVVNGTQVTVPAKSTMILVDKASFDAHPVGSKGTVNVKYVDTNGNEIATADTLTGKVGTTYTTTAKTIDNYILSSTPSNASGTYTDATQTVTYIYKADTTPKGTVTVKYVDKATNKEISTATVLTGKQGTSYTTSAATVSGYAIDTTSLPANASGVYTSGNIEVIYYYNVKIVKNVTVHYYNVNNWTVVNIYAYDDKTSTTVKNYTGSWPGVKMTSEGNGWFSYDIPAATYAKIILNNGTSQEPASQKPGYEANGEVWIKNGVVSDTNPDKKTGTVNVKYVDESGKEIATATSKTGDVGTAYTTTAPTISGYTLKTTPANVSGTFTDADITVTYVYKANVVTGTVKVNYVDQSGATVASTVTKTGNVGTAYTTTAATVTGYTLKTTPTNASGTFTASTITVTYIYTKNVAPVISSYKTSLASPQVAKTSIKLTTIATGTGAINYKFIVTKAGQTVFTRNYSATSSTTWTPTEAGTYTVSYKVKDSTGIETTKTRSYVITAPAGITIDSITTSVASPQVAGTTIKITTKATSSNTLYYRYWVCDPNGDWTILREYSTSNTVSFNPTIAGQYYIWVDVKDNKGNIEKSLLPYEIKA